MVFGKTKQMRSLRKILLKSKKLYAPVKTLNSYRQRLNTPTKLFFFFSLDRNLPIEAYKLFSILEMQVSAVLLRSQLIPFFFLIPDLCFYRLVYLNGHPISRPHLVISLFDTLQLPVFLYQLMSYRQNRFYYYPSYYKFFFKTYWGQFVDYTSDKIWILSNAITSRVLSQVLTFDRPNILLYMSPFRRFSKLYYRSQPERMRADEEDLMYTYTVFKLKLFNYVIFYR